MNPVIIRWFVVDFVLVGGLNFNVKLCFIIIVCMHGPVWGHVVWYVKCLSNIALLSESRSLHCHSQNWHVQHFFLSPLQRMMKKVVLWFSEIPLNKINIRNQLKFRSYYGAIWLHRMDTDNTAMIKYMYLLISEGVVKYFI